MDKENTKSKTEREEKLEELKKIIKDNEKTLRKGKNVLQTQNENIKDFETILENLAPIEEIIRNDKGNIDIKTRKENLEKLNNKIGEIEPELLGKNHIRDCYQKAANYYEKIREDERKRILKEIDTKTITMKNTTATNNKLEKINLYYDMIEKNKIQLDLENKEFLKNALIENTRNAIFMMKDNLEQLCITTCRIVISFLKEYLEKNKNNERYFTKIEKEEIATKINLIDKEIAFIKEWIMSNIIAPNSTEKLNEERLRKVLDTRSREEETCLNHDVQRTMEKLSEITNSKEYTSFEKETREKNAHKAVKIFKKYYEKIL